MAETSGRGRFPTRFHCRKAARGLIQLWLKRGARAAGGTALRWLRVLNFGRERHRKSHGASPKQVLKPSFLT